MPVIGAAFFFCSKFGGDYLKLSEWLDNPVIRLRIDSGDEMEEMRRQADELAQELESLKAQLARVQYLYHSECTVSMRMRDLLRDAGIKFR